MNPFTPDKVTNVDDFCGREKELKNLLNLISAKSNVMLYGDRRYGKTSLIRKAFSELSGNVLPVYVDIYDAVDELDFVKKLYTSITLVTPKKLKEQAGEWLRILGRIKGVEFQPSKSGDGFSFKPTFTSLDFDELLQSAITLIDNYCEHSDCSHAVIAFDEFQQVAEMKNVKIDAKLRQISQDNSNVSFIFSGSKKTILRDLLNSPTQPWHGMTTPIPIKGIELSDLKLFCEKRLGGSFEFSAFENLYEVFRGQTRLILQACFYLFSDQIINPKISDVERVIKNQVNAYDDEFRDKFLKYSPRQKKALKAVAKMKAGSLFSASNLKELNMSKQALNQAILSLEKVDDIQKQSEGIYIVSNITFSLWLRETD
ncbi:AAA family ATPase [Marinomonas algicola]|uniref:AAA family ATPase n=1 Tax=Marinomonas algicola TaxID=2773454 RepID=UPI00174DFF4E|nr:ATP-binding protein [Marinomonas algicola]